MQRFRLNDMKKTCLGSIELHNRILIITAVIFIAVISMATVMLPKADLLYRENRKAASRPDLSMDALADGRYGEALSSYINDNTALRQFFIEARCVIDEMIMMKIEENGILIGKEARLFAKDFKGYGNDSLLDKNIDEIAAFASESDIPVSVMIIPSASSVNPDMLPAFAPQESEYDKIKEINNRLSDVCNVVDIFQVLNEHNTEYIYYRNDHHWTTQGAYYAYTELAKCLGKDPVFYDWDDAAQTDGFLGTHYARSRYFRAVPDIIMYFPSDTDIMIKKVVGDAEFEDERQASLINTDKLAGYDKYSAFLDGNNAYTVIPGKGRGRVLVVKDSFANCLIPLMKDDFEQTGVVDYRNYSYGLRNLAEKERYDSVLIIYSYAALGTDSKLVYINRPKAQTDPD